MAELVVSFEFGQVESSTWGWSGDEGEGLGAFQKLRKQDEQPSKPAEAKLLTSWALALRMFDR